MCDSKYKDFKLIWNPNDVGHQKFKSLFQSKAWIPGTINKFVTGRTWEEEQIMQVNVLGDTKY